MSIRTTIARNWLWVYIAAGTVILAAIVGTFLWLGPMPPKVVVMTTGAPGSAYDLYGQQYKAILKRSGVELRLMPSPGGVENLRRLNDPRSGVMVGFAQGGLTSPAQSPHLESLGTLSYEPFWLFYRTNIQFQRVPDLAGKKISVGPEGSGTRALALKFFALNGIDQNVAQLFAFDTNQAGDALFNGTIDAAGMLESWDSPTVRKLLASSEVSLIGFPRADAYVALYPYLNKLILPMGVGNMATNRPANDVNLIAPKTSLIVRDELNSGITALLLEAAQELHSGAGIFQKAGQFPAAEQVDVPLSQDARQFYKSGPPFLQRYLPFWLATLVTRLLVLLIPLVGVVYPLVRFAPAIYAWSMRRRIFRLYGELKVIELELETGRGGSTAQMLAQLERLDERANRLLVPNAFAQFLYQVRNHIALVRARLQDRAREEAAA